MICRIYNIERDKITTLQQDASMRTVCMKFVSLKCENDFAAYTRPNEMVTDTEIIDIFETFNEIGVDDISLLLVACRRFEQVDVKDNKS